MSEKWQVKAYEILNICPCSNILAVFAYDTGPEHPKGTYVLGSEPIHFLAVCKATIKHYEGSKTDINSVRCIAVESSDNQVCGLTLNDGWFEVVNDMCNFAGLCHEGEDIRYATGFLESKYRSGLLAESRAPR